MASQSSAHRAQARGASLLTVTAPLYLWRGDVTICLT